MKNDTYFHTYDIELIAAVHPFYVTYDHMFCIFGKLGTEEHVRYPFHMNPMRRNDFRAI